ncbi:MAG: DUF84 family protein, partial [Legionellales bacterium]
MNSLTQQIIDSIIIKKALLKDFPKPGVNFLAIDSLFNDSDVRQLISKAVFSSIDPQTFDAVAGIASRGYLFSGMIANQLDNKGEFLVQKVKVKGDSRYVQIDTSTEYSSDALQILKDSIQPGKKYLVTDDLIATGGSVKTAIQLIRQCGGQVDTVFVLTELTDFKAKEALAKEGVALVSVLQFSKHDLEKILLLQKCYAQNPSVPLTYQLSQGAKGTQALTKSNQGSALTVHLASQSPLKKEALQLTCAGLFDPLQIEIMGHDAQSGVNAQPLGYTETAKGAANRLKALESLAQNPKNALLVSIENGIRYSEEDHAYHDFIQVLVKDGEASFSQTQDCCIIPEDLIKAMRKDDSNAFMETWGDAAKRLGRAKDANDPHQEPEFGGLSRREYLFKALCQTLGKLKENKMRPYAIETDALHIHLNRLVELKGAKPITKYAKRGVFFISPKEVISKPINFYNHGCPVAKWS